jgi:hypothetical protein
MPAPTELPMALSEPARAGALDHIQATLTI